MIVSTPALSAGDKLPAATGSAVCLSLLTLVDTRSRARGSGDRSVVADLGLAFAPNPARDPTGGLP